MSTEMKMGEAMYLLNKTYQDHNLKIGVLKKSISENGGKTLMQVSDHYFTTQVYFFNCLTIKQTAFLLPLDIFFSE